MKDSFFCNIISVNHERSCTKACVPSQAGEQGYASKPEAYRQHWAAFVWFQEAEVCSPPRPASSEPNPWSDYKQICIFSSERLWISFWCQSWRYRAGMSHIHLIISFIVVRGCAAAYVWITWAHSSETDLFFQMQRDRNDMPSFSAPVQKKKHAF